MPTQPAHQHLHDPWAMLREGIAASRKLADQSDKLIRQHRREMKSEAD